MLNWKRFLQNWATDGGTIFMLFLLHNMLLIAVLAGYSENLKEPYFLVLGALIGILKGEGRKHSEKDDNESPEGK